MAVDCVARADGAGAEVGLGVVGGADEAFGAGFGVGVAGAVGGEGRVEGGWVSVGDELVDVLWPPLPGPGEVGWGFDAYAGGACGDQHGGVGCLGGVKDVLCAVDVDFFVDGEEVGCAVAGVDVGYAVKDCQWEGFDVVGPS